jgi:Kef-type K+ transport system membrane component KefB
MSWSVLQAEPAFGFTVVGLIIVFGPLIAERLRLPGLLGLLVFGAVVGPNVLDLFPTFATLRSIGDIGVLYLIFLSGLQLDLDSFAKHWRISVGFGTLTSIFPLTLGTLAAFASGIDLRPAILIGSFWASFTLIAYPIITRYGLTKNRAVAAIVGASAITDTVSLVILALIVGAETGDVGGVRLAVELGLGFVVLAVYCFVVVPAIARWFFSGLGQERTLRFILVLVAMTSSAVVAEVVGIEALIGAFFVGVGLNRLVPNASPLMAVTEFFGNAFFIPAFLVSVGLLFDPQLIFRVSTIRLALGFAAALILGKFIAAVVTGRIFRLERPEVGLMFSVSVAQAAATLAATIVGRGADLYGDDVVNAVMLVVAISLILTSVGSERFAPLIEPPAVDVRTLGEAILIPIEHEPAAIISNLRFAGQLAAASGGVLQPLVIVTSTDQRDVDVGRRARDEVDRLLRSQGQDVETALRIDRSVATGVHRASIEANSSMLLLPWPDAGGVRSWLLGAGYREILAASSIPTAVAAIHDEPFDRVVLVARRSDLIPGRTPTLLVAARLVAKLVDRDRPLAVGPLAAAELESIGVELPDGVTRLESDDDVATWLSSATRPGDLVVVPIDDRITSALISLHEAGRSVLAIAHNPVSDSSLTGSSLTFPIGGSLGPT